MCRQAVATPSTTIDIDERPLAVLRELARRQGQPMHVVLNQAIDSYRRDKFLEEANEAYASLRSNANAWKAEQDERDLWDHTSGDGLEHE